MASDDVNVTAISTIISPKMLKARHPLESSVATSINNYREDIADIIHGRNKRLLVIVGPCSIHDPDAALDYATKLSSYRQDYIDSMYIVMRVYFEKPRTTVGWKGLINDPHMDGSNDINYGLNVARDLLLQISKLNLPVACEFLDVFTPQYLADLVSWGAIGARTTESQLHRELASGLSPPIGFKNGTDGNIGIAIDAILCAQTPHTFLGINSEGHSSIVKTKGNPTLHVILRGSSSGPNYDSTNVSRVQNALKAKNINTKIIIDCSHGNSNKNFRNQTTVLESILEQLHAAKTTLSPSPICGIMVESNIEEGNQAHTTTQGKRGLIYGKSVTDECISLKTTAEVFARIHEALRQL